MRQAVNKKKNGILTFVSILLFLTWLFLHTIPQPFVDMVLVLLVHRRILLAEFVGPINIAHFFLCAKISVT